MTVRLFGLLRLRFAGYDPNKGLRVTLPAGASLRELLQHLGIGPEEVGMLLVQDKLVRDMALVLADNQRVEVFAHFPHGG